ncbi:class I SAM-dependent methyltransferase [Natronomonas sp. EA1]|uniref:class I SAM-dependent methyltransferase n=1 Tax=Natronomonas sp. EA1 TaxID=3421655 RepID=UPI003EC0DBA5
MDPVERTRRTYEAIAEAYHDRTKDLTALVPAIEAFCGRLPPEPRVLDAGCGPGRDAAMLAARGCDVVGVDFARAPLHIARDECAAELVQGDLRALPFRERRFDGIWACASLLHLPVADLTDTLAAFHDLLSPGGVLFVSVQRGRDEEHDERVVQHEGEAGRYFRFHTAAAMEDHLREAGFTVEELETDDEGWVTGFARR